MPYGTYQVPERAGLIRVVSRRFIRHAHQAGVRVQVWTVDEQADMERLLGWGADGLPAGSPVRRPVARLYRGPAHRPYPPPDTRKALALP